MSKLTKAQNRVLEAVADGEVWKHFDVYAGYWWTERDKRLPAYGKSDSFPPLPIRYLLAAKLINPGEDRRPFSGRCDMPYVLTDAGRAAEIESGARYRIDEYDGSESVETVDSYEWDVAP